MTCILPVSAIYLAIITYRSGLSLQLDVNDNLVGSCANVYLKYIVLRHSLHASLTKCYMTPWPMFSCLGYLAACLA
jgi:hypothetical protein